MNEPKKYTAKEAMHRMIDHPGEEMVCVYAPNCEAYFVFDMSMLRRRYAYEDKWEAFDCAYWPAEFYIRAEYDTWQAAITAEKAKEQAEEKPDEKEPRVGESLYDYTERCGRPLQPVRVAVGRWIEANFVRREGR
jgi:hypothetical protein